MDTQIVNPPIVKHSGQSGMSLIETTIALVIIMVALLGVVHAFTYTVIYNAGNAARSESLAVLQRELENLRAAKWTSSGIAPGGELNGTGGGTLCTPSVTSTPSSYGGAFLIERTVDDDPFTNGCQVDANTQLKEITLTVRLATFSPGWQMAVPATVVFRRTRGN